MNEESIENWLTSLFRFGDNISWFWTTPGESIFNHGTGKNVGTVSCYLCLCCVTMVTLNVEAKMEYELFGIVECLQIQFGHSCNVHMLPSQVLPRAQLRHMYHTILFAVLL